MDRLIGGSVLVAIQVVRCEVVRRKDHRLSEIIIGPLSPVLIKSQHASSSEPLFIMESGYTASKFRFLTLLLLGVSLDLVAQLQMLSQRTPWPTDQSCGPIIHITFFKTFIMQSFFWGISSLAICMAQELLPQPKFMLNVLPDIQLEIISLNFRSGSTLYKLPVLVLCPAQQAVHIFTSH